MAIWNRARRLFFAPFRQSMTRFVGVQCAPSEIGFQTARATDSTHSAEVVVAVPRGCRIVHSRASHAKKYLN